MCDNSATFQDDSERTLFEDGEQDQEAHPYNYSEVLAPEHEDQLWKSAQNLMKRNQDASESVEGILSLYVQAYLRKKRFYDPAHGTMKQFLGLIVNNVNYRLTGKLIRSQAENQAAVWLDSALELHGEKVTSDEILQDSAEARFYRKLLAADVHDVISMLDCYDRKIAKAFLICQSVRETARRVGCNETSFQDGDWQRFKQHFIAQWEQSGLAHAKSPYPPRNY